jgi:hypothetical protein
MGEQSVGKSYALNHFVDTSFAGSAMRCTAGVWLSVTPTDEELIVALDFEGEICVLGAFTVDQNLAKRVPNMSSNRTLNSKPNSTKVLEI